MPQGTSSRSAIAAVDPGDVARTAGRDAAGSDVVQPDAISDVIPNVVSPSAATRRREGEHRDSRRVNAVNRCFTRTKLTPRRHVSGTRSPSALAPARRRTDVPVHRWNRRHVTNLVIDNADPVRPPLGLA